MSKSRINITGFTLKVLAIVGMTCNHVAHLLSPMFPNWFTFCLYSFGGLTFPIMAFILTEGYLHTSNLKKYAIRLAIFAVVSQVPYFLAFGITLNVLFTLLVGLFVLWAYDNLDKGIFVLALIGALIVTFFCDWGPQGTLMILCFYLLRDKGAKGILITMLIPYIWTLLPAVVVIPPEIGRGLTGGANAMIAGIDDAFELLNIGDIPFLLSNKLFEAICNISYAIVGFTLATFFLCHYRGVRGRSMKWFFYAYYPLHLFVLWGIGYLLGIIHF